MMVSTDRFVGNEDDFGFDEDSKPRKDSRAALEARIAELERKIAELETED